MKMFKLAEGDGDIVFRLEIDNKTGEYNFTILGHTDGPQGCSVKVDGEKTLDQAFLEAFQRFEVEGFGDIFNMTEMGDTSEAEMAQPMTEKPQNEPPVSQEDKNATPGYGKKTKGKEVDMGYGGA